MATSGRTPRRPLDAYVYAFVLTCFNVLANCSVAFFVVCIYCLFIKQELWGPVFNGLLAAGLVTAVFVGVISGARLAARLTKVHNEKLDWERQQQALIDGSPADANQEGA